MRILITGSPGVGKTLAARSLAKKIGCRLLNERQFALEQKIGKWDTEENELIIPLVRFGREMNKLLSKEKRIVVEGHLLCELRLKADFVVLITIDPELLEARLEARGYGAEKVQDNVFCEGIEYCKKHVLRNYPGEKVVIVECGKNIKETLDRIIKGLKEKGAKL